MADIVSVEGVRFAGDTDPTGQGILDLLDPVVGIDFSVAGTFIVDLSVVSLFICFASP